MPHDYPKQEIPELIRLAGYHLRKMDWQGDPYNIILEISECSTYCNKPLPKDLSDSAWTFFHELDWFNGLCYAQKSRIPTTFSCGMNAYAFLAS